MSTLMQRTPLDLLDQALEEAERTGSDVQLSRVETQWVMDYIRKSLRTSKATTPATITPQTLAVCNHCDADGVCEKAVWFTAQGVPLCDRHGNDDTNLYPVYPVTVAAHQYEKLVRERDSYESEARRLNNWISECQTRHKCIHTSNCTFSDEL